MNIFLLSMTDSLDPELQKSIKSEIEKRGNKVAYISSEPQVGDQPYYLSTIKDYHAINKNIQVDYFDLSENFSNEKLLGLADYGTIYLSGGNTYVFMDSANKRKLAPFLKKYLEAGWLLIGASAGAIMMTPSIDLAGYADENTPQLKDATSFGFVDFEFHPHFSNSTDENEYLSEYKKKKNVEVYVCENGDGMFVSGQNVRLFGNTSKFLA